MVAGMLMPLHDLRAIYEILFRDGVMVAKKDKRPQIKHPEVQSVSNLQVIRAMGSLKSRGYVKETFAWKHFYWYLTNDGIVYLRDYLHLPTEIVPATLQRIRKPAATLAIAHRAARVQSVEGPTSYVPKPGRRAEAERREELAERQGYRHKMVGSGERENNPDRTPRFRGRPLAGEPAREKALWEVEGQPQDVFRKTSSFRSETAMMEDNRGKRATHQELDVYSKNPIASPQKRRALEVEKEKPTSSAPAQTAALKQDVSQTTLTSSKTALPLAVAAVAQATGAAASKIPAKPSAPKTNEEMKTKDWPNIAEEQTSIKPTQMITSKPVLTMLPDFDAKEDKMKMVVVDPVKVANVSATAANDQVKPQQVMPVTSTGSVKETKLKVNKELIKPTEVKAPPASAESKIINDKAEKVTDAAATQETAKAKPHSATSKPKGSTNEVKDSKTDEVSLEVTTVQKSSTLEVKSTITTATLAAPLTNAEDAQPVTAKAAEMTAEEKKTNSKGIPPVRKEAPKGSVQERTVKVQDESDTSQPPQNAVTTEVLKETKQAVEGGSKSKRKKKKSQAEALKSVESAEGSPGNKTELRPVASSEPLIVSTCSKGTKTNEVKLHTDREKTEDVPKQITAYSEEASLPLGQIPAAPLVEGQIKEKSEESNAGKIAQGPLSPKGESNVTSPHMEPVKSEEITVTKVETVTVQKISGVELVQASPKSEQGNPAPLSEPQKPTIEAKSAINTEKATQEPLKGKKKGKGRKQPKEPELEDINTNPVPLPEAETLPSTDTTPLHEAAVKDSPDMASGLTETNVSLKMTLERMCSEEVRQAAAVLSEAPADKREVEPALLFAEKIKREAPKPETSSSVREAPTAGELASAARALTAEPAAAQAQASPLFEQEEPPTVAQHSAARAAECSTEERLSVSEALTQEGEKKRDLIEDTPSATATPVTRPDQPHQRDTCKFETSDIDEATMKRKIVVVEEIVEVKQLLSPEAAGQQSPPPPVESEEEGEELDLDVLQEIAIERAVFAQVAMGKGRGASPEVDWDHSLGEPEEKTWPNFMEGLFECVPAYLLLMSL